MRFLPKSHGAFAAIVLCVFTVQAQQSQPTPFADISTVLMQSTFRVHGPAAEANRSAVGTVFIIGRPLKADPTKSSYVLVTAAHVLGDIQGRTATLSLRKKNADQTYTIVPVDIPIRAADGKDLFLKHKTADVAAMYVALPKDLSIPVIATTDIVDDDKITELEIHPGDELLCLGYPFGLSVNDWGFPILRSGTISSYPLTPASAVRFIGFDFRVYGGNSGGPVYFKYNGRTYGGEVHLGQTVAGVIGLVSGQVSDNETNAPISLARIVPGQFIKEAIDLLPELP